MILSKFSANKMTNSLQRLVSVKANTFNCCGQEATKVCIYLFVVVFRVNKLKSKYTNLQYYQTRHV